MSTKTAIIIGAGPAGLTAAYELLEKTDITPLVLEMSDCIGGISRTVNYKGNRIDIGGHRFFSKSDRVMEWWLQRMPQQASNADEIHYHGISRGIPKMAEGPDPEITDKVMLVRSRKSRIYFLRKLFDYPLKLNIATFRNLGIIRMVRIACSYACTLIFGPKNPSNLEEFFINRFGRELYNIFFKSYTEKVWGQECSNISAEWGAQRIKGLSIGKALLHFLKGLIKREDNDIQQKGTETSLIDQFLYPKFGPGQMWEIVADEVKELGGTILMKQQVTKLHVDRFRVTAIDSINIETGKASSHICDYVFSTMPVKELIETLDTEIPKNIRKVATGLVYRDFITVGLLAKRLKLQDGGNNGEQTITDNWIYIQEPEVRLGRLQVFNNWSPYMLADPTTAWIGLEYFCQEDDALWNMSDKQMVDYARRELAQIGIIEESDFLDGTVIRMAKTYPAYFGTYERFDEIRDFVDQFENLFLIGRNGMHKYNNQDHSMLTAMTAVENIVAGSTNKSNIWDVNTEQEYHENK